MCNQLLQKIQKHPNFLKNAINSEELKKNPHNQKTTRVFVNAIDLFSNQILEFLADLVEKMP